MQPDEIKAVEKLKGMLSPTFWEIVTAPEFSKAWEVVSDYFKEKWELSAHGYVNQGDDPRTFGRIGAFIQHLLSFTANTFQETPYEQLYSDTIIFVGTPPYIAINIELPPTPEMPVRYAHCRLGWRYDENWTETGGYIISAAAKIVDHELIYK